jgi:ribose-phosphate pyrophosphokinase
MTNLTMNLVYPEKSEIKYKISKFPDGQQTVDILSFVDRIKNPQPIKIKTRLRNFGDLEILLCATQALREQGYQNISVTISYFVGARSDRKFADGGINYLKTVICPIINSQNYSRVTVLDPHSDVLEGCLNNFRKINNHSLIKTALEQIDNRNGAQERICLVSPDAGAYKKIFDVAQAFKIPYVVTANKIRDLKTGAIVKTEIPNLPISIIEDSPMRYVIIDDICDGGRTFVELAKAIREQIPEAKIFLVITHGIFSAGFAPLNPHFDRIFVTNSYTDYDNFEENTKVIMYDIF